MFITKGRKFGLLILGLLVLGAVLFGWREYTRKTKPVINLQPAFIVPASQIIDEFEANDTLPAKKYSGKLIAVTGTISSIDKDDQGFLTVVLKDAGFMSSVRCAMDSLFANELVRFGTGQTITIKGMFTGYQKDETGLLGSDIILNRCVVDATQTNKREKE
jgi:hypothetical protein